MDVTKLSLRILYAFFVFLFGLHHALAEMMQKGKTKVKSILNFYHQNSDDGRQVYDNSGREEANVVEPMIFVEHQITEDTAITGQFVFDSWTAASDTKLDEQTGASGNGIKGQTRFAGNLGFKQEKGKWSYSGNAGISTEYDYRSINASFNVQRSMAKDNFVLGLGVKYFDDSIKLFNDLTPAQSAYISSWQSRKIFSTSLTASQLLTRKDIIQGGVTFVRAQDNLESTASTTVVNGQREVEKMPDSRSRYALSTKWVHALNETNAINLSYRYYFDQWDLSAHTIRAAYLMELNEQEDVLEFSFRVHDQSAVDFYGESFNSLQSVRTSDSDLSEFTSYEVGSFYQQNLGDKKIVGLDFEDCSWNNGLVYAQRDSGLRYGYYQTSFAFSF